MKDMDSILDGFLDDKKRRPTSERSHIIQEVCDNLFSKDDFKKILMQTSNFTVEEIRDIYHRAKSWDKNPSALFWKLVREKQKEIKKGILDTQ